jgi:beta-ureidopropionase / N-carbamoyl-L-amino-acid hydrolase
MTSPGANLRINGQRLWDSLMEMAKIGPDVAGGNNRQTLTDADSAGRHLFAHWCAEAGMAMGDMFATLPVTKTAKLPTQHSRLLPERNLV